MFIRWERDYLFSVEGWQGSHNSILMGHLHIFSRVGSHFQ